LIKRRPMIWRPWQWLSYTSSISSSLRLTCVPAG
jgi:hypothetical protein